MILNESMRFEDAEASVRKAFLRVPDKMLLAQGVQLYKWTNRPLGGKPITAWWSFVETTRLPSGTVADGFRTSEERARRIGRTHREFARARAAISGQYTNTMDNLVLVQLKVPAWGFAGYCNGQPEFAEDQPDLKHVVLIGGAAQVWIPNLTLDDVTQIAVVA